MKARLLVFALALCAFVGTARGPAWAVTSNSTLNNLYACAGTGVTDVALFPFTFEGVLVVSGGSTVSSPSGAGWIWNVAGFPIISIAVTNGNYFVGTTGEGTLVLNFSGGLPTPLPPVSGFNNQINMANIDAKGIAHTFTMTFTSPSDFPFAELAVCQAESEANGNPVP
jgi:hypothetical protein